MTGKILKFGKDIYTWLSQFGTVYRGVLPAGVQPDDIYLLISGYYDNFASEFIYPVQIYQNKTTSYENIIAIADEMADVIGEGGLLVNGENLKFKVDKGSPFYQDRPDEDETVRAGYVNLIITIY